MQVVGPSRTGQRSEGLFQMVEQEETELTEKEGIRE
jgi:hypothetical protein